MGRSRRGSSPATARRFFLVTAVSFGFPAPGTLGPTHATMGTFDGIHRGHLALLKPLIAQAKQAGAASVLVTFEPHPDRKSTRLNSSHLGISYAVLCLKKK